MQLPVSLQRDSSFVAQGRLLTFPTRPSRLSAWSLTCPTPCWMHACRLHGTHFWPKNTFSRGWLRVSTMGICTPYTGPLRQPRQRAGHCFSTWLPRGAALPLEGVLPWARAGQGCRALAAVGLTQCFADLKMVPASQCLHGQGTTKCPTNRLLLFLN